MGKQQTMTPILTNAELVDEAGRIKAAEADAKKRLEEIKAELIRRVGANAAVEGSQFRVTLSETERETLDEAAKLHRDELFIEHTSPQYRAAHTERTATLTMRVVARTGKAKDAA